MNDNYSRSVNNDRIPYKYQPNHENKSVSFLRYKTVKSRAVKFMILLISGN